MKSHNLMAKKSRFHLFGFSITEQSDGFAPKLKKILLEDAVPHTLHHQAIGGATFNILPFLFNKINISDAEVAIFEISSCLRFTKDPNNYKTRLQEIAGHCLRNGTIPCFVQLYRHRVDYSDDPLTQTIDSFCNTHGFPCLNLVHEILKIQSKGQLLEFLRDGTHTTELGSCFYAEKIAKFLQGIPSNFSRSKLDESMLNADQNTTEPCFFPIEELAPSSLGDLKSFSRGNIANNFLTIVAPQSIEINLPQGALFSGLMVMMGPRTGKLRINFPEFRIKHSRVLFDRKSYYRRYSFWFIRNFPASKLILTQLPDIPEIKLDKPNQWMGEREAHIVGVLATRDKSLFGKK